MGATSSTRDFLNPREVVYRKISNIELREYFWASNEGGQGIGLRISNVRLIL